MYMYLSRGRDGASRRVVTVAEPNEVLRVGLTTMLESLPSVSRVISLDTSTPFEAPEDGDVNTVLASSDLDEGDLNRVEDWASRIGAKLVLLLGRVDDERLPGLASRFTDGFISIEGLTLEQLSLHMYLLDRGVEAALPARLTRRLLQQQSPDQRRTSPWRRNPLTQREIDVLGLLSQGFSNKQIAPRIGISEHGVKRHVGNILAKLNCSNRTEAVSYALQQDLLALLPVE